MQRVLILDKQQQPLMPCHPARARQLLREGKAAVFRRSPFTIILKEREGGEAQPVELKLDPGSKTTGIALVVTGQRGRRVVWAAVCLLCLDFRLYAVPDRVPGQYAFEREERPDYSD